jgi:hypothetical protein
VSTWCQRGVSTVLTWRQHSVNTVSTWCQRGVNMVLTGCQRGVQTARPCEHPKGRHGPAVSWQREPRNGPGRCPVLGPLRRGLGSNGVAVERVPVASGVMAGSPPPRPQGIWRRRVGASHGTASHRARLQCDLFLQLCETVGRCARPCEGWLLNLWLGPGPN